MPTVEPGSTRSFLASGALFTDDDDRVLLVVPNYKEQRDIPGGMVQPGESPRAACIREVEEELALVRQIGRLLVIDSQTYATGEDITLFIFDGGTLDLHARSKIRIQEAELDGIVFVPGEDLAAYLPPEFAARLAAALDARTDGTTYDLERGVRSRDEI